MPATKPDMKADTTTPKDRRETISLMEPMLVSTTSCYRGELNDLAVELAASSAKLVGGLPHGLHRAVANLVRSMNCYYSNLIEGHYTHPNDIDRALKEDFSANTEKRNLQLEAKSHIAVQQWIDDGGLTHRVTTMAGILETHRRFCELLPEDLLWVVDKSNNKREQVVPGMLHQKDVIVGRHVPISPGALPRFIKRYETAYGDLGKSETIIATPAAHHRLLWIHPFIDGNGRVARLVAYAMLSDALGTGGIWSIARGLAHNEGSYKQHLAACDSSRRNDLDGRGNLSEENLVSFTKFFLTTCLDQVKFMEGIIEPQQLRERVINWATQAIEKGELAPKADKVLEAILYRGELPRNQVISLLDVSERQARRVMSSLAQRDVIRAESMRSPWYLVFPAKLASRWMPGLFPE